MKKRLFLIVVSVSFLAGCNFPGFPGAGRPAPLPTLPTARPAPVLTATASPVPASVNCGEDVDCLIQAAQACQEAQGVFPMRLDFFGAVSTTVLEFEFLGPEADGTCRFTVRTQSVALTYSDELIRQLKEGGLTEEQIEAQRAEAEELARQQGVNGECRGPAEAAADLLRQWQEGRFTSEDWDPFVCTGGSFGNSGEEIFIEATVVVETPSGLPALALEFSRVEDVYDGGVLIGKRYHFSVTNWEAFSPELFVIASDLPPCGKNPNASRSWLTFYDADSGTGLYGYCGVKQPQVMSDLGFFVEEGKSPPRSVYLELWDRREDAYSRSNLVRLP